MRKDGSFVKTQRMKQIAAYIAPRLADGAKINIAKALAWIEINIGLSNLKAGEYLNTLARAYDWHVKDGFLTLEDGERAQPET